MKFGSILVLSCVLICRVFAMEYPEAQAKLKSIGQEHLLQSWEKLNPSEQKRLLEQIDALDAAAYHYQRQTLASASASRPEMIDAFEDYSTAGNQIDKEKGLRLIAEGRVGCLLIAGGQGTRLRIDGPKGIYPVTVIKQKSLFQLFAERVVAAGKQVKRLLPLAIMTSPLNHEQTVAFFKEHDFFGLKPEQVTFFQQSMLPFLDKNGNLLLDNPYTIAQGPDGNGSSLSQFYQQGIWKKWQDKGVQVVNYVLIDNALADPFDAELIGFHHRQKADITSKCTFKRKPEEKVGLLVKQSNEVRVVEYSEMPESERFAKKADGSLKHLCANLSLFCLNMSFIRDCESYEMPLHGAFKAINGNSDVKAWKFEKFIFDIFPKAKKVVALLYPREICFAPLKNFEGDDSPQTVRQALQNFDRQVFTNITGNVPVDVPFELSPQFYYPTPELLRRWKNAPFPNVPYIE